MSREALFLSAGVSVLDPLSDPEHAGRLVELAERAQLDLLCLGDSAPASPIPAFDALVAAAWLAPRAAGVGLVPLVPALASEPFHVARALSALDFLTAGRSGWQPTSGAYDAQRFGAAAGLQSDEALAKAEDFVAATTSLWDSWDSDALIIDTASGIYLDPAKVRPAAHHGRFFQVHGPLNAARPPQGHPILVQGDRDPLWRRAATDVLVTELDTDATAGGPLRAGRVPLSGTTGSALEDIERRFRAGRIDGLHLVLDDPLADLARFIEQALPELRRRGLLSLADRRQTLRSRLKLKVPGVRT